MTDDTETATSKGVSLYPNDWEFLETVADDLGLQGSRRRSRAMQHILRQYRRFRDSQPLREELRSSLEENRLKALGVAHHTEN